jgi:hypothetical protein
LVLQKIATAVLANHVKKETAKSGALGVLAGLAATTILRRSIPGAIVIGGVVLGRQIVKMKRSADARRAAESEAEAAAKVAEEKHSV